ncbi:hypothetical protein BH11MYX1_BH11MYX1_08280 [soil metagenome]
MQMWWLGPVLLAACGNTPALAPDAATSAWTLGPALEVPRLEAGVTAYGQTVVVVGGFYTNQEHGLLVTNRVDLFDPSTSTWSKLAADAPVARHHVQVATLGTTLYLLGGLDAAADAQLEFPARADCYSIDLADPAAQWKQIATMPTPRGSAAVVVASPRIYLFGGSSTTDALASNVYYDTVMDAWCPGAACGAAAQLPDLPAPRSHPAAVRRTDGTFAVIGGLAGLAASTAANEVYVLALAQQTTAGVWTTGVAMPTTRGGCAFGSSIEGKLICAGGEASRALSVTEGYDPVENTWTTFEQMPVPTAGTLGAAIGQRLFVPGGARELQFQPTDTLYIFAPLDVAGA